MTNFDITVKRVKVNVMIYLIYDGPETKKLQTKFR